MGVLLFSMVLYLLGIAILLFFRPQLMFRKDGSWKEFGVGGDEFTVFPFWMFCIAWAILSYGIARMSLSTTSVAAASLAATKAVVENVVHPLPTENKPGYYKLDTSTVRKKGAPRYIYVGPDAPSDLDE